MVSSTKKSKKIFISHIHEEAEVAKVFKEWLESTFTQNVDVFVSSDPDDNPPGTRWLNNIEGELQELDLMMILCSRTSVGRPWINFEAGASWVKKVPIIPFCYLEMHKRDLPSPLSELQALNLSENNSLSKLMNAIAKHLGLPDVPRISYDDMSKELSESIERVENSKEEVHFEKIKPEISKNREKLNQEEEKILILFGSQNRSLKSDFLSQELQIHDVKVQYHLTNLVEREFLYDIHNYIYGTSYSLSDKGNAYLVENDLLI